MIVVSSNFDSFEILKEIAKNSPTRGIEIRFDKVWKKLPSEVKQRVLNELAKYLNKRVEDVKIPERVVIAYDFVWLPGKKYPLCYIDSFILLKLLLRV